MCVCMRARVHISLQIDDSASESFLGLIIAIFPVGSLVAAPVFGVWSNYWPVAEPLVFSLIIYSSGNLLYIYAKFFSNNEKWILFSSRFIVGAGIGSEILLILLFGYNCIICFAAITVLLCSHIVLLLLMRMSVTMWCQFCTLYNRQASFWDQVHHHHHHHEL